MHVFRMPILEVLHEILNDSQMEKLERIAGSSHQDSDFHYIRGWRDAILDIQKVLIEYDRKQEN